MGKVALIGFDALPEALLQVRDGNMTATIEQMPGGQVSGAFKVLRLTSVTARSQRSK